MEKFQKSLRTTFFQSIKKLLWFITLEIELRKFSRKTLFSLNLTRQTFWKDTMRPIWELSKKVKNLLQSTSFWQIVSARKKSKSLSFSQSRKMTSKNWLTITESVRLMLNYLFSKQAASKKLWHGSPDHKIKEYTFQSLNNPKTKVTSNQLSLDH